MAKKTSRSRSGVKDPPSGSTKALKKQKKNKSNIKNSSKLSVDKQTTPRNKERYPALNFKRQVKLRKDYFDGIEEYVDQLSPKEKEWLNRFLEETVVTNFKHKGPLIYKTKKARREFYNTNNARNRCMQTKAAAMGMLDSTSVMPGSLDSMFATEIGADNPGDVEDAMLTAMELKDNGTIAQEIKESEQWAKAVKKAAKEALKLEQAKLAKRNKKSRNTR